MANQKSLSLSKIIVAAWHNIKGCKKAIWAPQAVAFLIYLLMAIIFITIAGLTGHIPRPSLDIATPISFYIGISIFEIIVIFIVTPLFAGAQMTALKYHQGKAIKASMGFHYWHKWIPLGFTTLFFIIGNLAINRLINLAAKTNETAITILITIIGVIAILTYVAFFIFNLLFVTDQNKGPWQALYCSAKAVAPHWLRTTLIILWISAITIITVAPTILGLMCPLYWVKLLGPIVSIVLSIWTIPYTNLIIAATYHQLSR